MPIVGGVVLFVCMSQQRRYDRRGAAQAISLRLTIIIRPRTTLLLCHSIREKTAWTQK